MLFSSLSIAIAVGFSKSDFQEQLLVDEFLNEVVTRLEEVPVDGRFGMARVPTLHGRGVSARSKRGADPKEWIEMWDRDLVKVYSFGNFVEGSPTRVTKLTDRILTVKGFESNAFTDFLSETAVDMMTFKTKTFSKTIPVADSVKKMVEMRTVFAKSEDCATCHKGVVKGDPVGVISLIRT